MTGPTPLPSASNAESSNSRPLERGVRTICFLGFRLRSEYKNLGTGTLVQRLFSTFPEGWPGAGLLFLRAIVATPLIQHGIAGMLVATLSALVTLQLAAAGAAALLLVGLWTPVVGVLTAFAEVG